MATNTDFPQRVAQYVDSAIRDAGENTKSVAEGTGIARMTLARRLTGSTPFTVAEVARIATHLGTTPEQLMAGQAAA
ncbi:helix-turn-helix domain-containing protein [Cryobacterium cryoconiti]|uniref:HTH cro/C1-type domain-containing protein n=1 Tax=Cryobacterium cryoconiti TaxID=1259239 RepID=A0A4Y8JXZ9_9MICO|nr:helix-turn-helix transcriptional regulator [Cryobacterium cryoconiti]TFD27475.1 hypothetical protein E3T49_13100 [Cryobacterium cryoconiti]